MDIRIVSIHKIGAISEEVAKKGVITQSIFYCTYYSPAIHGKHIIILMPGTFINTN